MSALLRSAHIADSARARESARKALAANDERAFACAENGSEQAHRFRLHEDDFYAQGSVSVGAVAWTRRRVGP